MKVLKIEFQVLFMHMTSTRKTINNIVYYVKKVKRVKQVSQTKVLARKSKNAGKFGGSYSRGLNH